MDDRRDDEARDGGARGGVTAPAFLIEFIEALRRSVGEWVRGVSMLIMLGLRWRERLSLVAGAFCAVPCRDETGEVEERDETAAGAGLTER